MLNSVLLWMLRSSDLSEVVTLSWVTKGHVVNSVRVDLKFLITSAVNSVCLVYRCLPKTKYVEEAERQGSLLSILTVLSSVLAGTTPSHL